MKTLTAARTLGIAKTGLAIVVLALVGCSVDDLTDQRVATLAGTAAAGEYCPDAALPHVLFLEDANGNAFQLMHSPGQGWKYLAAAKSEGVARTLSARKVDFSPVAASYAETTPPGADPMAVFIDGPTGYTFAWNADTGWKFVGHITEQHR
jgi:hypothetical protein